MNAYSCDCGWRIQVLAEEQLAHELRVNLPVALQHWQRGHKVGTPESCMDFVKKEAVLLAIRMRVDELRAPAYGRRR